MRNRAAPYTILTLLAALLGVLPVALFADLNSPIEKWQHYWPGQPTPVHKYDMDHLPPPLRVEFALFKALVAPPAFVFHAFGGHPGSYGISIVAPLSSNEGLHINPPFTHAYYHLRIAIPFWLLVLVGAYELARLAARRLRGTAGAV